MSKIKLLVVLVCMTFGLTTVAKGQIYESEACFYAEAGSSSVSRIVRFEGSRNLVWVKTCGFSRQKLAKSKNYYENETWTDGKDCAKMYKYDHSLSTSAREVYKCETSWTYPLGYWDPISQGWGRKDVIEYVAFSKDKTSYITWYVNKNDVNNEIEGKSTFTRVPKEDLLPKAANYDFLNE